MDLGLNGRTAAVAGGSAGLGFATAQALANDGVRVVVCGRDEKRAADAAAKIGKSCVGISCDVSSVAGSESFVEQATKILGQIYILILNSGGPPPGTFASTSVESYDQAFANGLMSMIDDETRGAANAKSQMGQSHSYNFNRGASADCKLDFVKYGSCRSDWFSENSFA